MIGVFDSGFGGLTVLKAFLEDDNLKQYDYLYLGDNARAPYGSKSDEVIYAYTREAVEFLFGQGCELIVLACNTASAKALRRIQQEYLPNSPYKNRRVLGVIIPVAEKLAEDIKKHKIKNIQHKIGIIGTSSTIASGSFNREIEKQFNPNSTTNDIISPLQSHSIEIFLQAAPLLVPLIEEGWSTRNETRMILKYYLRSFKANKINHLVLGCTHYPLILKQIKSVMAKSCHILNTPEIVAQKLSKYLELHNEISTNINKSNTIVFYTTDDIDKFITLGSKFFNKKIRNVNKISISQK